MHLDSKQSQFRPGESLRSKNVPDVLFVDEDGNPIEAGAENLIYVDEAGNEVPEELAIRLLESGKYIDSRLLYDEDMIRRSNSYASSGLMGSNSQAVFNASKGSTLGTQSDFHSTKQSSSYISKQSNYESKQSSYDSKPSSYATSKRSSSFNTSTQQAQLQSQLQAQAQEMARVQAQLFAEAHAHAQAKADEIAQIEADAQSNYGSTLNTDKHTPTVSDSKSSSQTTVNRTAAPSTDRRLPTVPPVKKTESYAEELADFDSYIDEQERKMSQQSSTNKSSARDSSSRPSTQKSNKSSQDKKLSMKEQIAKQKGEIQHNLIKNQLLKKQQELLEQQELERKQQEIIAKQQGIQQQKTRQSHHSSSHHHHHHHQPQQHEESHSRNEIPSVISRVSAYSDQRSSRNSGQSGVGGSRYSGQSNSSSGTMTSSRRDSTSGSSRNNAGSKMSGASRLSELSRVSESSRGTDGPAASHSLSHHQMNINRSVSNHKTPKVSAHIPVPLPAGKSSRRAANSRVSDLTSTNTPAMKTNREFANNYDILQMRQVGQLSGNKIIRNFSEANLSELENYYENEEARGLEFEPTNLDIKPNHFIDPFSPDLFKDEIIDIDFGAIDAFTEALNAQINSEKNGQSPPKNLQFPSHILSSNHASFIDNQLLLGDSSINGGDGHSGINVQFVKPSKDSNSYYASDTTTATNSAPTASTSATSAAPTTSATSAADDGSQYSHTNSFGSLIDVQKNRSNSTHDFNTTNRQSVLTSLDNLINATNSSRTASTRYSNSTYVR